MSKNKYKIIYEREYDNPVDENGKAKPNTLLGKFKIKQTLMEDFYAGRWIGEKNGKTYLIVQTEVSGMYNPANGGSRYEVEELTDE